MPDETPNLLSARDVPQPHGPVFGTGEGVTAVGRKGHAHHDPPVSLEAAHLLAGFQVPELDQAMAVPRQCLTAIGRDGHSPYLGLSHETFEFLARFQVPQTKSLVIVADEGPLAVQGEDNPAGGVL